MKKPLHLLLISFVLSLGFLASNSFAAGVVGYELVSSTRAGRTTFDYTYRIRVSNPGPALTGVTAQVTSSSAVTEIVDGVVAIGNLAAGANVLSTDTFTLRQERTLPFSPAALVWTVRGDPATLSVPNVVGLSQSAATSAISGAGLTLGTVTQQSNASVPAGNVISQNPTGGANVAPSSAVNIVVSTGPALVAVPNVVGLAQSAASTAITGAGLAVGTVTQRSSASVPAGNVISQTPSGGANVAPGSAVNLVVSTGPALVSVPNVVTLTQSAATTAITGAGLVLGTVTQQSSASVPAGNVISQNPSGGANVAPGSAVNLVVSTGPALVSVPNVVGLTQSAASTSITGAGLVIGVVTQQSSASVPVGSVTSQNPPSGSSVTAGSAVHLIVSSGPAQVAVPDVVGLTQAAATTAITSAGLVLGPVTQQSSSVVPAGSVITQSPVAGLNVNVDTAVSLIVSSGPSDEGLLPGPGTAMASSAATDLVDSAAVMGTGTVELSDGRFVAASIIVVTVRQNATVAEVNALISSIGGRIVGMLSDTGVFVLRVPAAADGSALQALIQQLRTSLIVDYVGFGELASPTALPGNIGPLDVPSDAAAQAAARVTSLWNARSAYNPAQAPTLVVADCFEEGAPFRGQGLFDVVIPNPNDFGSIVEAQRTCRRGTDFQGHGYGVLGMIAADFGGNTDANQRVTGVLARPINLRGVEYYDVSATRQGVNFPVVAMGDVTLARRLRSISGEIVLTASMQYFGSAVPLEKARDEGMLWLRLLRGDTAYFAGQVTDLEQRLLHVVSAGNTPDPAIQKSWFSAAARLTDMQNTNGVTVPPQPNVIIVENRDPRITAEGASAAACVLDATSATGGDISAVGQVHSYNDPGSSARTWDGTSFAAPQVAGVAAWLLGVDPQITAASARALILGTTRPPCVAGNSGTNMLDAYAAALAADDAVTSTQAPVRRAVLDVSPNNAFDFADVLILAPFLAAPSTVADYSRYDLNGDGFTGGPNRGTEPVAFNLDASPAQAPNKVFVNIDSQTVLNLDERNVTDLQVLCYYLYTPLFQGSVPAAEAALRTAFGVQGNPCLPKIEILAETNQGNSGPNGEPFSGFDKVSVNNRGQVAFPGFGSAGISQGFAARSTGGVNNVTPVGSSTRLYGGSAINDSEVPEVAMQDRASGSPPAFFVRKWRADGSGQTALIGRSSGQSGGICSGGTRAGLVCTTISSASPDCPNFPPFDFAFLPCIGGATGDFDSATSFVSINDSGIVAFPGLAGDSTLTVLFAGSDRSNLQRLATFSGAAPTLRPQISNTHDVVYRDQSNRIAVSRYPTGATQLITGATYTGLSPFPGIAASGLFVAATGTGPNGNGIYLFGRDASGAGAATAYPALVTTIGDPNSPAGQFIAFNATTRVAVESVRQPDGSDRITVVFVGTRTYRPSPQDAQVTREGLYRVRAVLNAGSLVFEAPEPIIQTGDVLANGKAVSAFALWDPLSTNGLMGLGVSFSDGNRAVVLVR